MGDEDETADKEYVGGWRIEEFGAVAKGHGNKIGLEFA
jgi:hypothetical protein